MGKQIMRPVDPNKIDVVDNGAIVKVFLLEGAFPWNAPPEILENAGAFFENYALTHAALGFLVEESDTKHVLEFYATNYVGAFLPEVPAPSPTPAPTLPPSTPAPPVATPVPTAAATNETTPAPTANGTPGPSAAGTAAATTATTASPAAAPAASTPSPLVQTTPAPSGNGTETETETGAAAEAAPPAPAPAKAARGGGRRTTEAEEHGVDEEGEDAGALFLGQEPGALEAGSGGDVGDFGSDGWGWGAGAEGGNGTAHVTWNNAAEVRVTSGFDEQKWVSANIVAKITGLLYNDITGWSHSFRDEHPFYQPLSACGGSNERGGGGDFARKGSADSYDFVWAAFDRLAGHGVFFDQEVVLKPKRTVMCLFPEGGLDAVELVEAADNEEVVEYYRETGECVRDLAAKAAAGNASYAGSACDVRGSGGGNGWAGEGGVSVMLGLGKCLAGHDNAFVFHNSSAYLRLPLHGNNSSEITGSGGGGGIKAAAAPMARLVRYAPELPPRPVQPPGGSDRAYIVYIAVGLVALGFALAGLRALYRRKQSYGRGSGGSGAMMSGGGGGGGGGWRSGGLSGNNSLAGLGDFDIGGGYEGALFPTDAYSSGGLSGSRHEIGPMEVPLLNQSDSPAGNSMQETGGGGWRQSGSSSSRRSRGGTDSIYRGGSGGGSASGSGSGSGTGAGYRRGRGGEVSPPPFSRILGTMGGGPKVAGVRQSDDFRQSDGRGGSGTRRFAGGRLKGPAGGDGEPEQGPFGSGGGGGGGGRDENSPKRDGEPPGDEVFC